MKSLLIKRISVNYFCNSDSTFWMRHLNDLLYEYPDIEDEVVWDDYGLLYMNDGKGDINVDGQKIRMDEPKIVIFKKGCISKIDISRHSEGVLITFKEEFFNLRYTNNILSSFYFLQIGVKPFMRPKVSQRLKIDQLMQYMWQEFSSDNKNKEKILRSYLNIILFEIQNNFQNINDQLNLEHLDEKLLTFEKLVNQQFLISRSPSHYAKQLFITETYLNRLCKRYRNKTAGEIIRDRVYLESQRLLQHTQLSVNNIADNLGFDSTSYFITFFKKKFLMTPEEFRLKSI